MHAMRATPSAPFTRTPALQWVAENAIKPAVVSLSLGVPAGAWSRPLDDAVRHLTEALGISVVVAAGNSARDSCGVSPGRVPSAITVAASNIPTKFGTTRAGVCVWGGGAGCGGVGRRGACGPAVAGCHRRCIMG
jgi:subtilisin family serine protease